MNTNLKGDGGVGETVGFPTININITKTTETINTPTLDEKWRDFEAKTPILTKEHKKYIKAPFGLGKSAGFFLPLHTEKRT